MLRDIVQKNVQRTIEGVTYSFDSERNKWLSIGRCHVTYTINHKNINSSRWLSIANGIYTNNIGFKSPLCRKCTITAAIIQLKNISSCSIILIENDGNIEKEIASLDLNNENDKTFDLNIDVQPGSVIKCFITTNGNYVDYPFVVLECAARL